MKDKARKYFKCKYCGREVFLSTFDGKEKVREVTGRGEFIIRTGNHTCCFKSELENPK